jgi:23S rRNA (adenine2503-C2)-methyltransferase
LKKQSIKNISPSGIKRIIEGLGEKRHRKTQLFNWLYKKCVFDFAEMSNIPLELRERLGRSYYISSLESADRAVSEADGSVKHLLECSDGLLIETVLMDFEKHKTICVSSQVGCPLKCTFCNTGKIGFERNLRTDEILDQIIFFKKHYIEPRKRFNIVFMGMGEPFLNWDNVFGALELLNDMDGFALGEKRITVSTVGIPDLIDKAAGSELKFGLAVSLNGTTDSKRRKIMPGAAGIEETLSAAERFAEKKGIRTTLEYVLIEGANDTDEDARLLSSMTSGRPFKINIIPLNGWEDCGMRRPTEERLDRFIGILLPKAPAVTVRRSQGNEIGAACGQLKFRKMK